MPPDAPDIATAAAALEESCGNLRVAALARTAGLSARQFNRRFTAHYGMPPKRFAQLCRLRRALDMLAGPERHSLAAIAVDCGFYDQAHFSKAMRRFLGAPPLEVRRATIAARQGA
jgi:transcriptional regulator GlxA family with amidase domain